VDTNVNKHLYRTSHNDVVQARLEIGDRRKLRFQQVFAFDVPRVRFFHICTSSLQQETHQKTHIFWVPRIGDSRILLRYLCLWDMLLWDIYFYGIYFYWIYFFGIHRYFQRALKLLSIDCIVVKNTWKCKNTYKENLKCDMKMRFSLISWIFAKNVSVLDLELILNKSDHFERNFVF
jgi:hypothetical protein